MINVIALLPNLPNDDTRDLTDNSPDVFGLQIFYDMI